MGVFNFLRKHRTSEEEMTFVNHLEVLRGILFRSIIAVVIFAIVSFFFKEFIFDKIIFAPKNTDFITNKVFEYFSVRWNLPSIKINEEGFSLINIDLAGQFRAHLLISIIAGVIIAFPYIVFQLWKFIKPALKQNERAKTSGVIFAISLLFFVGVLFGYYLIIPLTLNFLSSYHISPQQVTNMISISSYISIVSGITIATGIVFELPVLIYFLSKIGILTPDILKKYRKHAVVVFFIFSGIITPPDVFSQVLVALPLFLLYEIGITISKRIYKKRILAEENF